MFTSFSASLMMPWPVDSYLFAYSPKKLSFYLHFIGMCDDHSLNKKTHIYACPKVHSVDSFSHVFALHNWGNCFLTLLSTYIQCFAAVQLFLGQVLRSEAKNLKC